MEHISNPIIVHQAFDRSREAVWQAITNVEQMCKWYFNNIPDFKPEVGFETQFNVQSGVRNFMHLWRVTEVIPLEKIAYSWTYEDFAGKAFVEFQLTDKDDKTLLTLKSYGIESFPQDIPEFKRESCQAGWDYFIKDSLKQYLEK